MLEQKFEHKVQSRQKSKSVNIDLQNVPEKSLNAVHGTEIKEARKFDDLVFEYIDSDQKVYRLLQAKHKLDEFKKITVDSLLTGSKGDYCLIKYFFSYQDLKKEEFFKGGSIKDVTICTNIDLDFEDLERAQIRVEKIEGEDDILHVKSVKKQSMRYRFNEDVAFILKTELEKYKQTRQPRKLDKYSDNDIKDFLNHLVFAINQPNEEELGQIIKEEMGNIFDFITIEHVYNKFFMTMLDWLQGKGRSRFFSYKEGKDFFDNARMKIPIWFNMRDPVESFTGRTAQLKDLDRILQSIDAVVISQPVSIIGLGGVGKSELARKYTHQYSQKYDDKVIWINAESYKTLVESFRRLARDVLKISTKNVNDKDKEITSIVEDVYKFFSHGKSLFIFDNAEKYKTQNEFDNGIEKFLPSLPSDCNRPYILITSRNQKWPKNVHILKLDVFNEDEATDFIKKSFNVKNDADEKDVQELAEELHFFPLALQQATAYIEVQNEKLKNMGSEFKINSYLGRYRKKAKDLLNFGFPEDSDNDYTKTILTTWNVTLDVIRQKENGNDALEILNIISYLLSEDIPTGLFLNLIPDEEKLGSAIELLKQYSMVNSKYTMLNVHRLVQQVIRIQLEEQNREEEILRKALKLFTSDYVYSRNVDHAMSAWNYSKKYDKLIVEFSPLSSHIANNLIDSVRYEEAYLFGLNILESLKRLPKDNIIVATSTFVAANNIGGVLMEQGKYDIALKIFLDILTCQNNVFGLDSPESSIVKCNVAHALAEQGKYDLALKYLQEVLDVNKVMFHNNHPDNVQAKSHIGTILLRQGKNNEALQILQEVDSMQEATVGKVHLFNTKTSIAGALYNQGKYNESLQLLQNVCSVQEKTLKKDHPSILHTKSLIATIYLKQSKYTDALELYQEVFTAMKDVLGEDHPHTLITYNYIALVLKEQGKYDKALKICQEVLNKQIHILGFDHPDTLNTQFNKALILDSQQKYHDALQIYQEVLSKYEVMLKNDHPHILILRNCIAAIFINHGKYDKAFQRYEEILNIQKCHLGESHLDTLHTKHNLGMVCYFKGDYDKALKIIQEVVDTSEIQYPNSNLLLTAKHNIGKILLAQGRHNEALTILQENCKECNKVLGPEHPITLDISTTIKHIESLLMSVNGSLIVVKNNNLNKLKDLVKQGADVNATDNDNRTLLHHAVNNGNIHIVNFLLKNGADVTRVTNKGNTPLHLAVSKDYKEIVKVLLQHVTRNKLNSLIDAKTTVAGTTSLHVASKIGSLDVVKHLLTHGAIYNIENKEGKTPLNLSVQLNVTNLLKLADELFEDAKSGNVGMIRKVKNMKPDKALAITNARNTEGNTLLQVAIANNHKNIASKLVEILRKLNKN